MRDISVQFYEARPFYILLHSDGLKFLLTCYLPVTGSNQLYLSLRQYLAIYYVSKICFP